MWLSEVLDPLTACSAIFLAAKSFALNSFSVKSCPFLETKTCLTVGSFSAAISPKFSTSTGTSLQPKTFKFWSLIVASNALIQKETWFLLFGKKTIPTAYSRASGISKSQTFLKKS